MSDGNGGKDDGLMATVLGVAVLGLALWLLWRYTQDQVLAVLRWYRQLQMAALDFFVPQSGQAVSIVPARNGEEQIVTSWRQAKALLDDPQGFTYQAVAIASDHVNGYIQWPALLLMGLLLWWAMTRMPGTRFRNKHSLESLIATQAKSWPVIAPIVQFNPGDQAARVPGQPLPQELAPFSEALSPSEFLGFHKIGKGPGGLDHAALEAALRDQLGPRWDGADLLPLHQKALFAAFALKGARKRSDADDLLSRIAVCWTPKKGLVLPKPLRQEIEKIVADPEIGGAADDIAWNHAFVNPALVRVLIWARQRGGVLAPAQFLWLRGVDRALWYPLNNAGRQSYHAEASGCMAHYLAELKADRPLIQPKLEAALAAYDNWQQKTPESIPVREGETAQEAEELGDAGSGGSGSGDGGRQVKQNARPSRVAKAKAAARAPKKGMGMFGGKKGGM